MGLLPDFLDRLLASEGDYGADIIVVMQVVMQVVVAAMIRSTCCRPRGNWDVISGACVNLGLGLVCVWTVMDGTRAAQSITSHSTVQLVEWKSLQTRPDPCMDPYSARVVLVGYDRQS